MDEEIPKKQPIEKSITHQLRSVTLRISIVGTVIALITFLIVDSINYRKSLIRDLNILGKIISLNGVTALTFNDHDSARTVLDSLRVNTTIKFAGFYNEKGVLLESTGDSQLIVNASFSDTVNSSITFKGDYIELISPVMRGNDYLGYLILLRDTLEQKKRLKGNIYIIILILLVISLLIIVMSKKFTQPLMLAFHNIVTVFDQVAQNKKFAGQAQQTSISEFNQLVNGFNIMLYELRQRDLKIREKEERLSLALQASGEGYWDWDFKSKIAFYDKKTHKILGYSNKSLAPNFEQFFALVHPEDIESLHKKIFNSEEFQAEFRVKQLNDNWIWVNVYGKIVERDEENRPKRLIGTIQDINDRHIKEEQHRVLTKLFQNSHEPTLVFDIDFKINAVNTALLTLTGYLDIELKDQKLNKLLSEFQDKKFFENLQNNLQKNKPWEGEIRYLKDGGKGPSQISWLRIRPMGQSIGTIKESFIAEFSDLLQRQKVEDELRYLANYDALTKLPNRRLFTERFQNALMQAKRNHNFIALLFLDLDRFKNINDSLGHAVGDELLIHVAKRLKKMVRGSDTLCRLGGDEFTILLENVMSRTAITALADKLIKQFSPPFKLLGHEICVSTSVGICLYPDDGKNVEVLMKNADSAMYESKKLGRDRYTFYQTKMNESAIHRLGMENDLRKALELEQFYLVFQPKIDLRSGKVSGAEALIRWQHPSKGLISPFDFIGLAEETGLIINIGQWVIDTACKKICEWQRQHNIYVNMAINVSVKQFINTDFPSRVQETLSHYNLNPKYIQLEVTESILMESADNAVDMLSRLSQLGVSLAIDDFGTGYSSLQYLGTFPIDCVKIDRSFITGLGESNKSETIVRAILAMAKGLGLTVVAEGIELKEQARILKLLNCDYAQGYFYSRPLEEEYFLAFLLKDINSSGLDPCR